MRRRLVFAAIALLIAAVPLQASATPRALDVATMVQGDPSLDGQEVRFSGEAIGESLRADKGARWVNVFDGGAAIGVVVVPDMLEGIDGFGEWSRRGTRVEVTGILNIACPQHGGDLDVHASELRVLAPSEPIERPVRLEKALVAGAALGVALVLAVRVRLLRRRTI